MNLAADPANIPTPQFVDLGLLMINALDKGAIIWTPATRVGSSTDVSHGRAPGYIFVNVKAVRDDVKSKSYYSYKTDF